MISVAGKLREWGADKATIHACLIAVADITMTEDPMPPAAIKRIARSAAKWAPGASE